MPGRTVVLLQFNYFCIRVFLFEVQDIADIGTAEFVNRLVVVPSDTKVVLDFSGFIFIAGQQADKTELRGIGILVLIHADITEPPLVIGERFPVGFK